MLKQMFDYYLIKMKLFVLSKLKIPTNNFDTITNIHLNRRFISINQIVYLFANQSLGRGAFGKVYPVQRIEDGAQLAIKVLSLTENGLIDPLLIKSFLNEINQSIKFLKEENHIVQIIDFDFIHEGLAFIVMECGNQDLEKTLFYQPTLNISKQKIVWKQILNIFLILQKYSLVHTDLKPSNLVFFGDRLKLIDLGNIRQSNSFQKGSTGTYGFTAPELYLLSSDDCFLCTYKSDLWSIGSILYWINYGDGPKYSHQDEKCFKPPSGIFPCKDPEIIDILQNTLRMDCRQRPNRNWLIQHPFSF